MDWIQLSLRFSRLRANRNLDNSRGDQLVTSLFCTIIPDCCSPEVQELLAQAIRAQVAHEQQLAAHPEKPA